MDRPTSAQRRPSLSRFVPASLARIVGIARTAALAIALAGTAACSGGGSDGGGGTPAATLQSITVAPETAPVASGQTQAFTATGHYSDGSTQDLTAVATWTSSGTAVATMSGAVATGVGEGTSTIAAEYGGQSDQATLTVTPAVVQSVTLSPPSATIAKGLTRTFTATAHWSDATTSDVTATAIWTMVDPTVATANGNVVTADAVGSTQVQAIVQGVTGSADVTVTAAVVTAVTVSPVNVMLAVGTTRQFQATAVYSDGGKQDVTGPATWASTDAAVASITTTPGVARGVSAGTVTISATSFSVTGSTLLTVTNATLTSISISPSAPTVPLDVTQAFTATGIFDDGTMQDLTTQVTWTSSVPAVATVSTAGVATPVATGTTDIGAAFGAVSSSTTLTVSDGTLVSLSVYPPAGTIADGTSTRLSVTGTYSDGTSQDLTAFATWSATPTAVATVSSSTGSEGLVTGVSPGSATVTATFGGQSSSCAMTVTSAALLSISVTPLAASVPVGLVQPLTATGTFSDGSTQDLTAASAWTSSDTAIAQVSNAAGSEGDVTGVAPGTVTLTASYGGVTGAAPLTVTSFTLVAIAVTPANARLPAGFTLQYTATATYSDSSTRNVTTQVTWASSNTAIATISNAAGSQGLATGVGASATPVQVTATLSGVSGSTPLTVTSSKLSTVAVTPSPFSIAAGSAIQLTATGTFQDGTVLDVTRQCTWLTSSRAIATVSRTGAATGVAGGSVTITAKRGSKQGSASGTVY